jgi:hypothetical protein
MRRVCILVAMVAAALWAGPAAAQAPASSNVPSGPIVNSWYLGANAGGAAVQNVGATFGVEGGVRVWKNLDAVGELAWVQDASARRQIGKVATLATTVAAAQGGVASSSLKVPALYGGIGVRWVFELSGKLRPYVVATVGGAKTELQPTISLNGANVTNSLSQYGVTLGQDVIGKYNNLATEEGIGVVMGVGTYYFDGSLRVLSIAEAGQRANVVRLVVGGGYRF